MMIPRTEGHIQTPDGERIWIETTGAGPDLVLSHGLGGNAGVWYQQLPYFAQRYRVITWDQRGFGRSSNDGLQHGPVSAVKDLLQIMDLLEVQSAHLVGQSMGGWVTTGTAIAAPERVKSVVLACTTGGVPVGSQPDADPALVRAPRAARPLGEHPAIGGRLPSLDMAKAYLYQALGSFGVRPSDAEFFRILKEHTYSVDDLAAIKVPVLLIAGELDDLMTPERIRYAAEHFTDSTIVELADRGHSPYFEDPDSWNEIVSRFLSTIEPKG